MKIPSPRLRLRTAVVVIAVLALTLKYIAIPLFDYYSLSRNTRDVLARLDRLVRVSPSGPMSLGTFLRTFRAVSRAGNDNGIPVYVDPAGLDEARAMIGATVDVNPEQAPLKAQLRRALEPLGLSYYVRDGLLTITSKQAADHALRRTPKRVRRP
jgi:hypothetical protein